MSLASRGRSVSTGNAIRRQPTAVVSALSWLDQSFRAAYAEDGPVSEEEAFRLIFESGGSPIGSPNASCSLPARGPEAAPLTHGQSVSTDAPGATSRLTGAAKSGSVNLLHATAGTPPRARTASQYRQADEQ